MENTTKAEGDIEIKGECPRCGGSPEARAPEERCNICGDGWGIDAKTLARSDRAETVVVELGDPEWPDPMFVVSACQLLQHGATAHTAEGRVVRVRLPHPPEIIAAIRETAIKMRDSTRGWSEEKTRLPPDVAEKLGATDESEMAFAVGAIHEQNLVVLSFGKAVAWLGLSPGDARQLADLLTRQADNVEQQAGDAGACTCGDQVGTYSRHENNPDGHGSTCPKFGPQ